jgi:hypothetical protein
MNGAAAWRLAWSPSALPILSCCIPATFGQSSCDAEIGACHTPGRAASVLPAIGRICCCCGLRCCR